jgi:aryl-alcohol dehydrogenase-like predicted oxidoreductase
MNNVEKRRLGATAIETARLVLGAVTFGREIDQDASFALLDYAVEHGIELIDTAEGYGGGQARAGRTRQQGFEDTREVSGEFHSSELIIGRWLKARNCRRQIILQTKAAPPLDRARLLSAVEASVNRLETDYVDLYLLHAFDPDVPIAEILGTLGEIMQAGKARVVGCSNFTDTQLRDALQVADQAGLPRLSVIQSNYSLVVRDIEDGLLPLCRDEKVGVQAYSPLGAGFLTGKYPTPDTVVKRSRFHIVPAHGDIYFHPDKFAQLARLQEVAARTKIPATQLAISWVLANPLVDCVLIGARKAEHIANAITAATAAIPPEILNEL